MPRDKRDPAARKPSPYERAGSAAINAMVARVAPAILELLADGAPRTKPAIVEALAGRHDCQEPGRGARAHPARGDRPSGGERREVRAGAGAGHGGSRAGRSGGQLLSRHEGLALIGAVLALVGLALAVRGTGSPMFSRRTAVAG